MEPPRVTAEIPANRESVGGVGPGGPTTSPRPLSIGIPGLDALGVFSPDRPTVVSAPSRVLSSLERRLILSTLRRGERVLMASGDNRLDAYGLLDAARRAGLEWEAATNVSVARAFTVHQYATILEETVPMELDQDHGLLLASGFLSPYLDEDVEEHEGRVLMERGLHALQTIRGPTVVATATVERTTGTRDPYDGASRDGSGTLRELFEALAPELVRVSPMPGGAMELDLPRHNVTIHVPRPGFASLDEYAVS